jgi:glucose uptake protein GlcU
MSTSILQDCTESCGWMAAAIAIVAFGSFGVPLKMTPSHNVDVNFFVMQSYKTIVCFATCPLVLLLGESIRWSWWGIVSGIFWVPGATCGVYAIRNAGLAISLGTWSSIQVLTSFFFGLVVFHERVKHIGRALLALTCLILGLVGMSRYAAQSNESVGNTYFKPTGNDEDGDISTKNGAVDSLAALTTASFTSEYEPRSKDTGVHDRPVVLRKVAVRSNGSVEIDSLNLLLQESALTSPAAAISDDENDIMHSTAAIGSLTRVNHQAMELETALIDRSSASNDRYRKNKDYVLLFGGRLSIQRRQLGIMGAVVNGAWGGLNLIPLHFAIRDHGLSGAGYLISYATGSFIVNFIMWIILYLYYVYQSQGNWNDAFEALPKFHCSQLGAAGLLAGALYSIGNFGSILAVTHLGQATGFCLVQMQLFVAGLWGVFFFREIHGVKAIGKWFASAAFAVVGIVWLSYEHEKAVSEHR